MTAYLLDLLYLGLLVLISPWLLWKSVTVGKYRQGLSAKLFGWAPLRRTDAPCIWLHAVSVGEVNLLVPLIAELRRCYPNWECVVSSTTRTGYELARRRFENLKVFYCPLDFSWAVHNAMRRIRPQLLLLAELELWPNLIRAAREYGARVAVVNGRLSQNSFEGYSWIKPVLQAVLSRIDLFAVQDETYGGRFQRLGAPADRITVTGSMKFDGVATDRDNSLTAHLVKLAGIDRRRDTVFLAGSTQEGEEAAALNAYCRLMAGFPHLRLVLVPRHPERFEHVARLLEQSGLTWQRRSRLDAESPNPRSRILLVDTIGELGGWWGAADIAFVGGSLGTRGGQNMIEPAGYGCAISFGPHTHNFRDIVTRMLEHQAAVVVEDEFALADFVEHCLIDPGYARELGARAQALVETQIGATARTVAALRPLIEWNRPPQSERRAA